MLSIHALSLHMIDYYLNLAAEEYYLRGGEPPGVWWGGGASALGLEGTVQRDPFHAIFQGYSPDGKDKLVQNAGVSDRHVGDDFAFSAPTSVSVCLAQSEQQQRKDFFHDHEDSVAAALAYAEKNFAVSRVGKGGHEHIPVQLVVAIFSHLTSREMDCRNISPDWSGSCR